jgi:hypothetical protein
MNQATIQFLVCKPFKGCTELPDIYHLFDLAQWLMTASDIHFLVAANVTSFVEIEDAMGNIGLGPFNWNYADSIYMWKRNWKGHG